MTMLNSNTKGVAQRLMNVALSNNSASVWCFEESKREFKKQPPIRAHVALLDSVSFGLNLFSVEQSMKVTLLLHGFPFKPTHDLHNLFADVKNNVVGFEKSLKFALNNANKRLGEYGVNPVSKNEIEDTLSRHRKTYETIRYLFVDRGGNLSDGKIMPRDIQVVYCIALAFIEMNAEKMEQENIAYLHMSKVAEEDARKIRRKLGI